MPCSWVSNSVLRNSNPALSEPSSSVFCLLYLFSLIVFFFTYSFVKSSFLPCYICLVSEETTKEDRYLVKFTVKVISDWGQSTLEEKKMCVVQAANSYNPWNVSSCRNPWFVAQVQLTYCLCLNLWKLWMQSYQPNRTNASDCIWKTIPTIFGLGSDSEDRNQTVVSDWPTPIPEINRRVSQFS